MCTPDHDKDNLRGQFQVSFDQFASTDRRYAYQYFEYYNKEIATLQWNSNKSDKKA